MRLTEQFTLAWSQVDFDRRLIRLTKTKNGSARNVPLNSVAMAALESQRSMVPHKAADLIFPRQANMPTIVRGSCPHSQRRESRIIRGIATDIHSVHGLQWPGSLSRKFKSWPATRRSACLPATLTFHQKSRQPHLNVSCSPHPLSDTTCTRPCTRQNIAPICERPISM